MVFRACTSQKLVVGHRGSFCGCSPHPNGSKFCRLWLSIVNSDHAVLVIELPGDDLEGVVELLCPRESPLGLQVEAALSGKESFHAIPGPVGPLFLRMILFQMPAH